MDLNRYQDAAMAYRLPTADEAYALLGLSGEVGELHSHVAKAIRDRTDIDIEHMKKELGDILWFVAAIAYDTELSLQEIAEANILKLQGRRLRNTIGGSGDDR